MKKILLILAAFGLILGMSGIAMATDETANLTVDATVTADCNMSVTKNLVFGSFSVLDGITHDETATVSIACTNDTTAKIWSATTRELTCTGTTLIFGLYEDAAHTNSLSTNGSAAKTIDVTGTGSAQDKTIYGRVPSIGNTGVKAGACTQGTMVLTVTY